MKIKWSFLYAMMAITLLLSACGSTNSDKDEPEVDDGPIEQIEDTGEQDDVEEENEVVPEDETDQANQTDDTEEDMIAEGSPNQTEPTDESDSSQEARIVNSDGQDFSINLLPAYKLTSEEPGRDILYPTADDASMRIETMLAEDGTYDYLAENMLVVLEASSNGEEAKQMTDEASLPAGDSITEVQAYTVTSETGPVTGIIFEREGLIVRLTIFDSANADYYQDFLTMGETITKN